MADQFDKIFEEGEKKVDNTEQEVENTEAVQDTQQEEKAEPVTQEATTQESVPESTPTEQDTVTEEPKPSEDWFSIDKFQEKFGVKDYGIEFENEDSIKTFFDKASNNSKKLSEYEQKIADYESRVKTIEEEANYYKDWVSKNDIEKVFGSKENAEKYYISKQLGKGRDPGVINRIISEDVNTLNDLDALSLKMQYNSPKLAGRDADIKKNILKKLGTDVDDPDFNLNNVSLDPHQEIDLAMQADDARTYLKGLKNNVEKPEFLSPSEQIQQRIESDKQKREALTSTWEDGAKRVANQLPDVKIDLNGTEFSYELDSKFKQEVAADIQKSAVKRGLELNEENIAKLSQEALGRYEYENRHKIYQQIAQETEARLEEKYDKKVTNAKPVNTNEKPDSDPNLEEQNRSKLNQLFGF
jgi:hypothetical protein